jgi:hypothetical protein
MSAVPSLDWPFLSFNSSDDSIILIDRFLSTHTLSTNGFISCQFFAAPAKHSNENHASILCSSTRWLLCVRWLDLLCHPPPPPPAKQLIRASRPPKLSDKENLFPIYTFFRNALKLFCTVHLFLITSCTCAYMYMLMLIFDVHEHGYWEPPTVTVQLLHKRNRVQITSTKILILSMTGPWLISKIPMGHIGDLFS